MANKIKIKNNSENKIFVIRDLPKKIKIKRGRQLVIIVLTN